MSELGPALTDEQWSQIRQIVHDEALRARVAASFLPLYGPLPGDATTVPADSLHQPKAGEAGTLSVDDYATIRLATVAVNVNLKNHMLADRELGAAAVMFRRAANIIARVEDAVIFRGMTVNAGAPPVIPGADGLPLVYSVSGATAEGLAALAAAARTIPIRPGAGADLGANVFTAVVEAIDAIEAAAYYKPYACVLASDLFAAVYTPMPNSMVLPADSLPPVLSGPLLRSSTLEPGTGIVVSLQGNPAEIVVGSDIHVRYLQAKEDGESVFRVSQRFVLRVKDATALALVKKVVGP
ncbi:putative linocin/CFP29 family protein [Roseiarcus fermentans]|uniref:Putative linocin/CFP29 family protein n=1 Tax=Roseiarcus fermentans TaxID=1473586 RepID=A0A366F319_9HYPH|nr:family 1 encapsulin nanocompartment shell protein [Roseiarcus fermentans]RBP09041.1 putative linocin/CFP29 family protein [Roseiarcus fermentans]